MFWPRMSCELKDYIAKCDICLTHRSMPVREPLNQHEFVARPWSKISADLCDLQGRTLLVVCDYFSNYIEVERVTKVNTTNVTKALKSMFARYGPPGALVSDNGPQFSSEEFAVFAKKWEFTHITSSPRYPQSNGKAENAVKTVKRLFTKCRASGESEFLALLNWRNTPTEGIGTSPAQRFFGRCCKTLLPMAQQLLQPQYPVKKDMTFLNTQKLRQRFYYNRQAKPLRPIVPGETIRMRLPGDSTWSAGVCNRPRSYEVKVGERNYRRNRRQLIRAEEPPPVVHVPEEVPDQQELKTPDQPVEGAGLPSQPQQLENLSTPSSPKPPPTPRRSTRTRKTPNWITTYVPS